MAEFWWKKGCYVSGMMAVGVLLGLVIFLCNFEIADFDLWLHLKTGEVIVEQGVIPLQDIFSCSVAGKPWNNHEWLFQAIFYLFLSLGGYENLFTAQAMLVALTFMTLIFLSDLKRRHYMTVFLLFLLTLVFKTRLTMRPDLFSFFFLAFFLYILAIHLEKKMSVWLLFIAQILWVNIHGFFIFGPLLILLSIVSELIKRHWRLPWDWNTVGRLTDQELKRLSFAFVATALACLVNPQFVKGALYPFTILFQMAGESSIFFNHIQELQKPIAWGTILTQRYIYYKLLILISAYSFFVNRKRIDISALLLWVFFLAFSLQAIRNIIYFGIVAYLVTILNFSEYRLEDILPVKFKRNILKLITIFLLNIAMIAWMVRFGYQESKGVYFDFDKYEMKSTFSGISQRNYPWAATDFIRNNKIQGNFFNDFNSGAFLIGRCSPNLRVFMDGRTELYGPRFFKEYVRILEGDQAAFLKAVDQFQLTGVFLGSAHNRLSEKTLQWLYQDKDWILVYLDYDAVIFLKDVAQNKAWIEAFRKDKKGIVFSDFDFERLGPRGVFPFREIKRAYNLEALGLNELALEQITQALLISPGSSEPYYIRGRILEKTGKTQEAFKNFRLAVMISPDDADHRYHLGLMYFDLGDYKKALREYDRALSNEAKRSDILLSSALAYLADEQYDKAMKAARKSFSFGSKNVLKGLKFVDGLISKKRYAEAFDILGVMVKAQPSHGAVYHKIGLCFLDLGEKAKAQEAFLRGLRVEPASQELKEALQEVKGLKK